MVSVNRVKAILLIAGGGERFESPLPKQFYPLKNRKVYLRTLDAFVASGLFEEIILVSPSEYLELVQEEVGDLAKVCCGGNTRQVSSYLGLLACGKETDIVVIHDGVRPLVSQRILHENVEGAIQYGAVDTCICSADTLVYAPSGEVIESIPNRSDYLRGQTPQSFSYPLILKAHEKARGKIEATDDCKLVLELGHKVHVVKGEETNIKITSPSDLAIAEKLTGEREYQLS